MKTVLTGIKPTGNVHLGNLLGAIRPAIEMSKSGEYDRTLYFVADGHALTSVKDPVAFAEQVYSITATWLALGLDIEKSIFFKQSDIKEVFELNWILACMMPKGDLNRAHSYKDRVQKNEDEKRDQDHGVNVGLFTYPVLMSADILLYDTNVVPVGKDQKQHVEIARSVAGRCNEVFNSEIFIEPQEQISNDAGAYVPGLDGRKMSKSYDNVIPLWATEKKLKKTINKIVTDSSAPEEPKDPDNCSIMDLYRLFADEPQIKDLERRYREGLGWGYAKLELFEVVNAYLSGPRAEYEKLMNDKAYLDEVLKKGADRAQVIANETMSRVRKNIMGIN